MSRKKAAPAAPEWSFFIEADKISTTPSSYAIKPGAEERKLLAKRLGIKSLESLKADLHMVREPGKMTIHVSGSFEAQVKQECVVSGKPVESSIKEDFQAWFADRDKTVPFARARQDKLLEKGNTEMPVLDESEDPEPLVEGKIDAGELVTQFLSLSINPYPHAEGVAYEYGDDSEKPLSPEGFDNPFAALKDWKARKDQGDL